MAIINVDYHILTFFKYFCYLLLLLMLSYYTSIHGPPQDFPILTYSVSQIFCNINSFILIFDQDNRLKNKKCSCEIKENVPEKH